MRARLSVVLACALYLAVGLVAGNVLGTGQAEPLRWLSASLYFAAGLAFASRSAANISSFRPWLEAALLSGATVLVFCGVAGRYWSWIGAGLLVSVNFALLALFGWLYRWKRAAPLVLVLAVLAGLLLPARLYLWPIETKRSTEVGDDRSLTIMTSLPIGPFRKAGLDATFQHPADPILSQLSREFTIHLADSLETPPRGLLLLAHPRALHPADLVAIDGWVRAGGDAVILTDPLLAWPDELPPGHSRRAPVTSLLDPLLAHWGLRLEAAQHGAGIVQKRLAGGWLLAMFAPGHFTATDTDKSCRLEERGLIARCRLGDGRALLLADADMLHPSLWMGGDGAWPEIERDRLSDNVALLRQWLGAPHRSMPKRTGWILGNRDICYGFAAAAMTILLLVVLMGWLGTRSGKNRE